MNKSIMNISFITDTSMNWFDHITLFLSCRFYILVNKINYYSKYCGAANTIVLSDAGS